MSDANRVITVDDFEHNLLINGFNEFRNKLIEEGQPTDDVDILLMKLLDAPIQRRRGFMYEGR